MGPGMFDGVFTQLIVVGILIGIAIGAVLFLGGPWLYHHVHLALT